MFIDYSKTALNREEHKKIVRVIHNLLNMNESVSFRKPVCYRGAFPPTQRWAWRTTRTWSRSPSTST